MSDPTLIADLARAGLDPELLQRVAMELARAQVAVEAIEKRRTSDRVRQGRTRHVKSRDTADSTLPPVPSPDGPPPPPAPPPPPLNPSPTPGSDPDGSADDVGQAGGASGADGDETRSFRRELMTRGIALICANTGRSEHSARGLIGHWLGIAHDEAVVVLGLIEEADGRELADFSTWIERRLQARREATGRRPDRGRPAQPAPTGLAARLIRQRAESLTGAYDVEPPAIDANDPDAGPSRGEDLGTAWQAGGASRPSDAVLRAAGQGGLDHRAAAALRARRAA
ncbi:hypothetical protein R1A27_28505 [Methylobacterium sp. NMS12]|uniref:hypothetical protein n=1 Tax=Methylobacterium sp. NMS12 TaxID=3079766 RepID=UPI003F883304